MNAKKFFLIDILFIFYLNFFFKKKDIITINKKPKIMGRIDQSVMERVVDIPFVSHFTSDHDRVDIE